MGNIKIRTIHPVATNNTQHHGHREECTAGTVVPATSPMTTTPDSPSRHSHPPHSSHVTHHTVDTRHLARLDIILCLFVIRLDADLLAGIDRHRPSHPVHLIFTLPFVLLRVKEKPSPIHPTSQPANHRPSNAPSMTFERGSPDGVKPALPAQHRPPPTMTEREKWFSMCMPNDLALPIYATTSLLHNASISRLDDRKGKRKGKGKKSTMRNIKGI